jgi:uncharacterized membrane protein HdeD (DUF308 family)
MNAWRRWQDYFTMLLGVVMFVTPFVFGNTSQTTAAYTAYLLGVLLFVSGLYAAAMGEASSVEVIPVVLGVITFIAPWVLGFTAVTALAWSAWIIGVLAVLGAGSVLVMRNRNRPARLA